MRSHRFINIGLYLVIELVAKESKADILKYTNNKRIKIYTAATAEISEGAPGPPTPSCIRTLSLLSID